jgi:hypothetical protein
MSLALAFKAFLKAWKNPQKAEEFINDTPKITHAPAADPSHLRLLSSLQQNARLIDFLKEDIKSYTDAQVGAAVRKIHQDCGKFLEETVTIRAVMDEEEGQTVKIPAGYNPAHIKVVGRVNGNPPYTGVVRHRGWKVHKLSLPKQSSAQHQAEVICPAEVEIR